MDLTGKQWIVDARPTKIDQVYGCDFLKGFVKQHAKDGNWPRGTLLMGKSGGGKTTAAKIIAQTVVCKHKDAEGNPCGECPDCKAIIEEKWSRDVKLFGPEDFKKDGDSSTDSMRKIAEGSRTAPFFGSPYKVIIVDEVQEILRIAQGAATKILLKELERPNSRTLWIFTSMDEIKASTKGVETELKSTQGSGYGSSGNTGFLRRLTQFKFDALSKADVMKYIKFFAEANIYNGKTLWAYLNEVAGKDLLPALLAIAEGCSGSIGMATKILQQCVEENIFDPNQITIKFGFSPEVQILEALQSIADNRKDDTAFIQISSITKENYTTVYQIMASGIRRAEMVRVFGKIGEIKVKKGGQDSELVVSNGNEDEKFLFNKAQNLLKAVNYKKLKETILGLNEAGYFNADMFKAKLLDIYTD